MKNAFDVLGVARNASKSEILAKVALLLRQEPTRIHEITQAQKLLFDSTHRTVHEFLRYLDPDHDGRNRSDAFAPSDASSSATNLQWPDDLRREGAPKW